LTQAINFQHRELARLAAAPGHHADQPICIFVWQWREQQRVDEAEDRRDSPDSQSKRQCDNSGERRFLFEATQRISRVLPDGLHHSITPFTIGEM
jgi:hypothetical protein